MNLPDWFHLQVQECGSYREDDVLEALATLLPVAASPRDSVIVLLDWFSAHRCDAVVNFIEGRGHIVLFHGGGCTPFTQVNDTHLHAVLQRFLIQLENQLSHAKRTDMHLNYQRGIPTLHRHEICEIVATCWRMVNHRHVARVGYMQTGPLLPDTGPIRRNQVYKDLRTVLDEIDPPIGLQEVGQKLRDDAEAFVAKGFPHKWSTWEHAKNLISEHDDGEDPLPEGLEGYGYDVDQDHDEDDGPSDYDEHDDDDDDGGGPGGGGGAGDAAPSGDAVDGLGASDAAPAGDVVDGASETAPAGDDSDPAAPEVGPDAVDMSVARAREILIDDARRRRDDVTFRRLAAQRDKNNKDQKDGATTVAKALQKRALEQREAEFEQRKRAREADKRASLDSDLAAQRKAEVFNWDREKTTYVRIIDK